MTLITTEEVRLLLSYNPDTGELRWLRKASKFSNDQHIGQVAGSVSSNGRRIIEIGGRSYQAHRLAWLHYYGKWPDAEIDHENNTPDDNRIKNLRDATRLKNAKNRKHQTGRSFSGMKGVHLHTETGKWRACIQSDGKRMSLGLHPTKEEAHAAYVAAATRLHGDFANHG